MVPRRRGGPPLNEKELLSRAADGGVVPRRRGGPPLNEQELLSRAADGGVVVVKPSCFLSFLSFLGQVSGALESNSPQRTGIALKKRRGPPEAQED